MKKIFTFLAVSLIILGSYNISFSQTTNVLLEAFTGTWCQWCPCSHTIVAQILTNRPNTLVLEYHGPAGQDPFAGFNGNDIVTTYGISSWPTGVIGRRSGVVDRSTWAGQVYSQGTNYPSCIALSYSKSYNSGTRQLSVTATGTSYRNIDTNVNISFVLYENNLVYPQTGNGSCPGGSNYVHNYVVRNMVNNSTGESFSTGTWVAGTQKTKTWTYTLPSAWVDTNTYIGLFAFLYQGSISPFYSSVIQTKKGGVTATVTGENNESEAVHSFYLAQNYPNPFNPTTNIKFSVPKDGNVSLKFYDVLGNEIDSYIDGFVKAGIYNAVFDGSKYASGVYFYKLTAGNYTETKRMILAK